MTFIVIYMLIDAVYGVGQSQTWLKRLSSSSSSSSRLSNLLFQAKPLFQTQTCLRLGHRDLSILFFSLFLMRLLLSFWFFNWILFFGHGMWDFSSLTRDQMCIPCSGVLTTGPPGKFQFPMFYHCEIQWNCFVTTDTNPPSGPLHLLPPKHKISPSFLPNLFQIYSMSWLLDLKLQLSPGFSVPYSPSPPSHSHRHHLTHLCVFCFLAFILLAPTPLLNASTKAPLEKRFQFASCCFP